MRSTARWQRIGIIALAAALGACGGGGDGAGSPPAASPPTAPAPTPTPSPSPAPSPSPSPSPTPAPAANDRLCGTILDGPYVGQESCASNGSYKFNSSAIRPICLGGPTCPLPFSYQVRIDTRPHYKRGLRARIVTCPSPSSNETRNPALCREPLRNTPDNYGMLGVRFDPPNGPVGPLTSITIELLTSTYMDDAHCTILGQEAAISDATTVEIADEDGNHLYLNVNVGGRTCTRVP